MLTEGWGLTRSPVARSFAPLRIADALLVGASLRVVCELQGIPWHDGMTAAAATATLLFLLAAEYQGLYRSWRSGGVFQELGKMLGVWGVTILALLLAAFVTQTSAEFSRRVFLTWWVSGPIVLGAMRLVARALARALRRKGFNRHFAAIVGSGELARRVGETIGSMPWMGYELLGFFDDGASAASPAGEDPPGSFARLQSLARAGEVDAVFVATPIGEELHINDLLRKLAGTPVSVYFVPDLAPFALLRSRWVTLGAIPTVSLFENPLSALERIVKRGEDLILGGVALAFAAIPMAAIAAAIKLSSGGPVLFRQRRLGLDGREIVVRKFRTMKHCETDSQFRQATVDDRRVTPLGRFLRSTSLDELPQLLDVVAGDMSMVGPRPHPLLLNERYRESIDWYPLRHRVKPGITGWAQINGFRGETDSVDKMKGRIEHDLAYIHNWSLWLDLKILALTPRRVVVGKNAY